MNCKICNKISSDLVEIEVNMNEVSYMDIRVCPNCAVDFLNQISLAAGFLENRRKVS